MAGIADVQRELGELGAHASERAVDLENRRREEQDRARTASLILYGGTAALLLALLLLWVTRPRWPATT